MIGFLRKAISRHVPAHFHDPFGLAMRLIRSGDPAARFALGAAALGLFLTPLDFLLAPAEKRRLRRAERPRLPLLFVCGPPRSGTTLVAQVLIKHLPVAHITNLTSLFPRSPLTASAILGRFLRRPAIDFKSYYGRTPGLGGINDGLHLWDRWLGADRKAVPQALSPSQAEDMTRFFGACEALFGKPIVNKNNHLCTCAHVVAQVLENASFICLTRDPLYLAQSQLKARQTMYGDPRIAYGTESHRGGKEAADPIADACAQVLFYERAIADQERRVGLGRFWVVSYESFCREPAEIVERAARDILRQPIDRERLHAELQPFEPSRKTVLDAGTLSRIEETLRSLRGESSARESAEVTPA